MISTNNLDCPKQKVSKVIQFRQINIFLQGRPGDNGTPSKAANNA